VAPLWYDFASFFGPSARRLRFIGDASSVA
jgi:hypothetical protein